MTANKSSKIVVIVLLALGVIAGLHFLVFRSRANEYTAARQTYEGMSNELNQLGKPKTWPEIFRFEYETINHEIEFYQLLRDANLDNPEIFTVITPTEEEAKREKERQLLMLWDELRKLQGKGGPDAATQLTFLNRTQSWHLLDAFPQTVDQTGTAVSDLIRRLQDTDALLQQLPEDSRLLQEQEYNYAKQLYVLGMNILPAAQAQYLARTEPRVAQVPPGLLNTRNRDQIKENVGELPAIFYTLNRIDLVKKQVPRDELGGIRTEEDYNRRLFSLFRLEYEDSVMFNLFKQMAALQEIVDLAIKHKVAEVRHVRMWDARDITWPPPEDKDVEEGVEGAMAAMGGGDMMGMEAMMFGMDPAMMMDPSMMDPSMMGGEGGMNPYMMGFGGMPGMGAVPEEEKDVVATAVPIELQLTASNSSMMAFLYELTHIRRTYAIDRIDLVSLPQQEGLIGATIVVKVLSYYSPFGEIQAGDMTPTKQAIEQSLAALNAKKSELATKQGAQELAQAEGFIPAPPPADQPPAEPAAPEAPPAADVVDPVGMMQ